MKIKVLEFGLNDRWDEVLLDINKINKIKPASFPSIEWKSVIETEDHVYLLKYTPEQFKQYIETCKFNKSFEEKLNE